MARQRVSRKERRGESRGGQLLLAWLVGSNTTQAELAERLGVRQTTVSNWLGEMNPRIVHALKLQKLAGVPLESWGEPPVPDAQPSTAVA